MGALVINLFSNFTEEGALTFSIFSGSQFHCILWPAMSREICGLVR